MMSRILFFILVIMSTGAYSQAPAPGNMHLHLLGTRSWIKVSWNHSGQQVKGYKVFYAENDVRPAKAVAGLKSTAGEYYIKNVKPGITYRVWLEVEGFGEERLVIKDTVNTVKEWVLEPGDAEELKRNPSSTAVPQGMEIFWQDEFNDSLLNRNKWSTNYYSSIDHLRGVFEDDMRNDRLPQPAYELNGSYIHLYVNDSLPREAYDKKSGKKISSIQTYDWRTDENHLDNSRGGYFEVRVKRWSTGKPGGLNTAYWFDSPGPDLKYYLEQGTTLNGVKGIRPHGQVFEIDVFEYLDAQFVLHGNVDKNGKFIHNLNTHIAKGYRHIGQWVTHGILWTPTSIKHYINGKLIGEYSDKHRIYSPNHFMNVFLGSYGAGGSVHMEVDYIRGYQWPLKDGNELPNPGFEYSQQMMPWEGNGKLVSKDVKSGKSALLLQPGDSIEQYVYLENARDYRLQYWAKGSGTLSMELNNVEMVTGKLSGIDAGDATINKNYQQQIIDFKTGAEYDHHKKTVRILFKNNSKDDIVLDDITIMQR